MSLRLIIPLSLEDAHLLPDFVELYQRLGGTPSHEVMLFPTAGVLQQAKQAQQAMLPFAKNVEVVPWEMPNQHTFPAAGNFMFQHCVFEHQARGDGPFYYFELDNTPREKGWMEKIEVDYVMSGCRFMGTDAPMRVKNPQNGQIITDEQDRFMIGTGIYPAQFSRWCDGQFKFAKFQEPWDTLIRNYTNRSLHKTKLIQHRWRTCNYREEEGKIICDNDASNPFGTDSSGEISKDAIVVHGCKDGSLARLIISQLPEAKVPVISLPVVKPAQAAPVTPLSPGSEVHYDKAAFKTYEVKASQNAEFNADVLENTNKVLGALQSSKKAMRMDDVTKACGIKSEKLREMTKNENCPFEITGPGWVRLRALEAVE